MRGPLILCVVAVMAHAGVARADEFETGGNRRGDGIDYSGEVGGSAPRTGPPGGTRSRGSGGLPRRTGFKASSPYIDFTSPERCLRYDTTTYESPEAATAANLAAEQRWLALGSQYALCPGVTRPPSAVAPTPGEVAERFWGEIPLPRPQPRIAPGYALTGKRAYLETGGVLSQPYERPTPLGTLTLEARGRFTVDWGDGTTTGPHADAGGPWPDGHISHVYEHRGTVTVTVTEAWEATWHLAGQSGSLTGLRTEAVIADFPVRELQAVRTR